MKIIFVLAALAAFASAASIPTSRGLKEDLQDFVDLIPDEQLFTLALKYFSTDPEFQDALIYFQGEEFSAVWGQFFGVAEVKELLNYLEDAGLKVYDAINFLADFLGLPHVTPTVRSLRTGGLSGFVEDVVDLLPLEKLENLFNDRLTNSAEFKAFFEKLQKFNYHKLVELHNSSKEVQGFLNKLRGYGLDVDRFFEEVAQFFGWE